MISKRFRLFTVLLVAVVTGCTVLFIDRTLRAQEASSITAEPASPGSMPLTVDLLDSGELSAQWWTWVAAEQAAERNPFTAAGDIDCSSGQTGPAFFLAGTSGGDALVRTCTQPILAGQTLFYPLVNAVFFNGEGENFTVQQKREQLDALFAIGNPVYQEGNTRACNLSSTVDGVSTTFMTVPTVRTQSDPFSFAGDAEAISDGYWALLRLPEGTHTIVIQGALCSLNEETGLPAPVFEVDVTYNLEVIPNSNYLTIIAH